MSKFASRVRHPLAYKRNTNATRFIWNCETRVLRCGAILNIFPMLLVAAIGMPEAYAAEISVREMQSSTYEIELINPAALSENEARAQIAKVAASTCKNLTVVFGKWKYEAKEAVGGVKNVPREPESFRFTQEISCAPSAPMQFGERRPTLKNTEEFRQVENEVQLKSIAYFRLVASKQVDEAVKQVATAGMGVGEEEWKNKKLSFQAMAGVPLAISISKITVYDNPAQAPEQGLYVAADYSNVYSNLPVHCGFLMWFRPIGGTFRITREETGHITSEQLKTIPSGQLPEIKRRLRCVSP
jgi:hypothetical protein